MDRWLGKYSDVIYAATRIVVGVLVALGLWAGYAAFIASGEMAAAYLIGHSGSGWSPLANKGELAVVYCFVFLFIAARGSGRLSADALMGKKSV